MSVKQTGLTVRRNTAIGIGGAVEQPVLALMADTVAVGTYLFGFDPSDPENERFIFAADGNATREANQHYAEPFQLYTWAAKRIALQSDDNGEAIQHVRLTLLQKDGESLSFVSVATLQSRALIRALRGDGPFDPPIPVIVTES